MTYRAVKGMNDILPDEIERWHQLENTFRSVVERYHYAEVRTPILERTSLFVRSIGETTDVVEKEMFTFERSKESLSMRPEGTAGAARAYLERKVYAREPVSRWYYLGPMFRAERPQRGRYRQFHQAGCEVYGDPGPVSDAEMIDMLVTYFAELGISGLQVCINSIGGAEARGAYREALLEYLRPRAADLSEHARARMEANPLRVLDSKDERDQAAVADAPSILDLLPADDRQHWDGLRRGLDALGTPYELRPGLVRGLDYYTRTLFEINATTGSLGAQNTLVGGGRYDAMLESLGGPRIPAIGFAMGLERILLAMSDDQQRRCPFCVVAPIGERAQTEALRLARALRGEGIVVDLDGRGSSIKAMLRRADASGARVCLVLGDSELDRGAVQVKDLVAHQQHELPLGEVVPRVAQLLRATGADMSQEDA
jgi:histidyl-tRNA synthetase